MENLRELEVDDETLPGTVQVLVDVPWDDVAAVLADEDQASADVKLAAEGDEDAFERSADADLLWFDVCERGGTGQKLVLKLRAGPKLA